MCKRALCHTKRTTYRTSADVANDAGKLFPSSFVNSVHAMKLFSVWLPENKPVKAHAPGGSINDAEANADALLFGDNADAVSEDFSSQMRSPS